VGALTSPEVGKYFNTEFVSTYQKVGTFTVAGRQKQGGNVATYFCTPDGCVLHVVAGPVNAATLLREARWVVETYKLAHLDHPDTNAAEFRALLWKAHVDRLRQDYGVDLNDADPRARRNLGKQGQVHLLLAAAPLPRLEQVYRLVFENILGEKVSTAPVVQR
jgi:hypothetical protein